MFHATNMHPLENEESALYIKLAFKLEEFYSKFKFTNSQSNSIEACITQLLNLSFATIEPDEKTKALFDKYNHEAIRDVMMHTASSLEKAQKEQLNEIEGRIKAIKKDISKIVNKKTTIEFVDGILTSMAMMQPDPFDELLNSIEYYDNY